MFIVLEGIDGAGTETQTRNLLKYLKEKDKETLFITYPDYGDKENPNKPIGKLIHDWLHEKHEFGVKTQFLLYSVDMVKDIKKITTAINTEKIIIADRYFNSTIAYQGTNGFLLEDALKYAEMFGLVKPDIIIFLDISSETSAKRKYQEKGNLDRFEKDKEFLNKLIKFYKDLADKNVFGEWFVINGERSKEEVFEDIKKIVDTKLRI